MTPETLAEAMGWSPSAEATGRSLPLARYRQLAPAFNSALHQAGCTTVNRAAMFCAQIGHESVGLKYGEEIASGAAYEGRRDLGNTQPGDGRRFKGHGWIQITGRGNHTAVSKWAHSKGYVPTPTFFVDHPTELASDRYVWIGPVWYWTVARARINAYCDAGDLVAVTKAINGGTHGLADRRRRWDACGRLGTALLPGPGAPGAGRPTLRPGDRDPDPTGPVRDLQNLLNARGA
jgi:predicted chitinase